MSQPSDEMDPRLRNALERLKTVQPADPEATARGRADFLKYAKSLSQPQTQPVPTSKCSNPFPRFAFATLLVVLLILGALVGGTGATVYAAQESLPDTPLYPVKILSEDVQTTLASQPEAKLGLLLSYTDRRVNEIATLNLQERLLPDSVLDRLQDQLSQALDIEAKLPDSELGNSLDRVNKTVQRQIETLQRVQTHVGEPAKPVIARVTQMLEEHRKMVDVGQSDPTLFRDQVKEKNKPSTPPGQERRATVIPPGQENRSTKTPPGQERRPTTPAKK